MRGNPNPTTPFTTMDEEDCPQPPFGPWTGAFSLIWHGALNYEDDAPMDDGLPNLKVCSWCIPKMEEAFGCIWNALHDKALTDPDVRYTLRERHVLRLAFGFCIRQECPLHRYG